jgi:hypothetical protein
MTANPVIPVAQYVRMSTEYQQYSLEKQSTGVMLATLIPSRPSIGPDKRSYRHVGIFVTSVFAHGLAAEFANSLSTGSPWLPLRGPAHYLGGTLVEFPTSPEGFPIEV